MADQMYYQIRVKGHLSSQWADWFGGLAIENLPDGDAMLYGMLPDDAALHGVLGRIRDLGLRLVALQLVTPAAEETAGHPGVRQEDQLAAVRPLAKTGDYRCLRKGEASCGD